MTKHIKAKAINAMSKRGDWSWRPSGEDIPAPKYKAKKNDTKITKKKKRKVVSKKTNSDFYRSEEWRNLRVRVLEKYGCTCMMCGRSPKTHKGVVVNVGHIKPRSKYPHLSLVFENLQILCESCNKGKGNKYQTDYRPDRQQADAILDELMSLDNNAIYDLINR